MTDQVICVNDSVPRRGYWRGDPAIKGQIYTIRDSRLSNMGDPGFVFHEIYAGKMPDGLEIIYAAERFRPYTPPPATDIEIFREIDRKIFKRKRVSA